MGQSVACRIPAEVNEILYLFPHESISAHLVGGPADAKVDSCHSSGLCADLEIDLFKSDNTAAQHVSLFLFRNNLVRDILSFGRLKQTSSRYDWPNCLTLQNY